MVLALSNGEVILLIAFVAFPVVAFSFMGAGAAFRQIGKGPLSIEPDEVRDAGPQAPIPAELREAEIRQFLEAKAYRQTARGESPVDVEAELARLLADADDDPAAELRADAALVAEVRELVEASNARRERMGREPLDVDAEVERRLAELSDLSG